MSALILVMPDHLLTLAAAREVARCEGSSADQLGMAADILAQSPEPGDQIDAREIRNALWSDAASELQPAARQLATRLLSPRELQACLGDGPGSVAPMHEARIRAERRSAYRRLASRAVPLIALLIIGSVLAFAALAFPAKDARSRAIYHQIMETTHE